METTIIEGQFFNSVTRMCDENPEHACDGSCSKQACPCKCVYTKYGDVPSLPGNGYFIGGTGWQVCPKCSGQGTVAKPPYLAAEQQQWSGNGQPFTCDVCKGKKIISILTGLPPQ